jgi:hypothetical protein
LSHFYSSFNRESLRVVVEGSLAEKIYAARAMIGRFVGAKILCEDPLIIEIDRPAYVEEIEELIKSLGIRASMSMHKKASYRCLNGIGNDEKAHDPGMRRSISREFWNKLIGKGRGFMMHMYSNPFIRVVSAAIPSAISTIGRFINDSNMMIVGAAISGGIFAIQNIGIKKLKRHQE